MENQKSSTLSSFLPRTSQGDVTSGVTNGFDVCLCAHGHCNNSDVVKHLHNLDCDSCQVSGDDWSDSLSRDIVSNSVRLADLSSLNKFSSKFADIVKQIYPHILPSYNVPIPSYRTSLMCPYCCKVCEHYAYPGKLICSNCFRDTEIYFKASPVHHDIVSLLCPCSNVYALMIKLPQKQAYYCTLCSTIHLPPNLLVEDGFSADSLIANSLFTQSKRKNKINPEFKYHPKTKDSFNDPTNLLTQLDRIEHHMWDLNMYNSVYLLRKCNKLSKPPVKLSSLRKLILIIIGFLNFDPRSFLNNHFVTQVVDFIGDRWNLPSYRSDVTKYYIPYAPDKFISLKTNKHRLFHLFPTTKQAALIFF